MIVDYIKKKELLIQNKKSNEIGQLLGQILMKMACQSNRISE